MNLVVFIWLCIYVYYSTQCCYTLQFELILSRYYSSFAQEQKWRCITLRHVSCTLSPVLSKIFESVLLEMFEGFLGSDNLQFGFKKKTSCNDALFVFNESLRYFTSRGCKLYTLCLKKVPTCKLSVTLSNLNRFSKNLHCWKAYEICYKTHITLPTSP